MAKEEVQDVVESVDYGELLTEFFGGGAPEHGSFEVELRDERVGRTVGVTVTHDGNTIDVPRIELIRYLFRHDWHRAKIVEAVDVPYQIVFGATKGQHNAVHAPGQTASALRSGGGSLRDLTLTEDEYARAQELGLLPESAADGAKSDEDGNLVLQVSTRDYARLVFGTRGTARKQIATELGVSYGMVYTATKDVERFVDPEVAAAKAEKAAKREARAAAKAAKEGDAAEAADEADEESDDDLFGDDDDGGDDLDDLLDGDDDEDFPG